MTYCGHLMLLLFQSSGLCVQSPSIISVPGILGQLWYLIVSIPDLCTLTYFYIIEILCNYLTLCLLELLNVTLANNEDPDEMPQNAIIHQDLHCLLRSKQSSGTEVHLNLIILTCDPLTYAMDQPRVIS